MTERRDYYGVQTVTSDAGTTYELRYEITVDEINVCGNVWEAYGVAVHCISGGTTQTHILRAITPSAAEIERIVDLLCRGTVFPEELCETLENILE